MTLARRPKTRLKDQRGATAVEFAVIAALLFVILFGILEFGIIFLQEHYVANAAREGVRIGVRGNNYNCFGGDSNGTCDVDREQVVADEVRSYLSTLYSTANILKPTFGNDDITRDPDQNDDPGDGKKILSVTVEVNNFFPPILSSLVKLLPGADFQLPATIAYTASGEYEDASEP